jgi:Uncharacterized protein conserved in bacteria
MLSRVANSLYWMSRYLERAENVARILDVNLQLALDFHSLDPVELQNYWLPIVNCSGDEDVFRARHPQVTAAAVTEFMVFDPQNPNSIVASIQLARENARMVRDQISQETWEQINRLYLFVQSPGRSRKLDAQSQRLLRGSQNCLADPDWAERSDPQPQ